MDTETIYHTQIKKAKAENAKADIMQLAQIRIQRNKAYEAEIQTLEKLKDTLPEGSKARKNVEGRIKVMNSNANSRPTTALGLLKTGGKTFKTEAIRDLALQEIAERRNTNEENNYN